MNELIRRLALIGALSAALGLAWYADFGEYLQLSRFRNSSLRGLVERDWGLPREEKERLLSLPFTELLKERAETPLRIVSGPAWEDFFNKADQSFAGGNVPREWLDGAEFSYGELNAIWFKPDSPAWNKLGLDMLPQDGGDLPIALGESSDFILRVRHQTVGAHDYSEFIGFTVSTPPHTMFYPYRYPAMIVAVIGILFYLLLPWTKPMPDAVCMKRRQVRMLDFAALWLFLPFFMLGWFFAGPIPVGLNGGWFAGAMLWLLCLGGLYLFKQGTFYSLFAMKVEAAALRIRTFQGEFTLPYGEIGKVRGAVLRNPRWLTTLLVLGAIFGRGSQSALAGGQAVLMGSGRYPGMALTLKKGGTIYLWGGTGGGVNTFKHMQIFHDGLINAGVEVDESSLEVRGFGTEPRFDKVRNLDCNWMLKHPLVPLMLTPFVVMAAIYGYLVVV